MGGAGIRLKKHYFLFCNESFRRRVRWGRARRNGFLALTVFLEQALCDYQGYSGLQFRLVRFDGAPLAVETGKDARSYVDVLEQGETFGKVLDMGPWSRSSLR
jgi:hypothetical protein